MRLSLSFRSSILTFYLVMAVRLTFLLLGRQETVGINTAIGRRRSIGKALIDRGEVKEDIERSRVDLAAVSDSSWRCANTQEAVNTRGSKSSS